MEVGRKIMNVGQGICIMHRGVVEAAKIATGAPGSVGLGDHVERGRPGAVGAADNAGGLHAAELSLGGAQLILI